MKAYLIDPVAETVTEVDHNGDYRQIYELIQAQPFTCVGLWDEGDAVYIDDEGLLNNPRYFFLLDGYPQPLAGRGLVLGADEEGESRSPKITLESLRKRVSFAQLSVQGSIDTSGEEDTAFGRMMVIRHTPIFGPPDKE